MSANNLASVGHNLETARQNLQIALQNAADAAEAAHANGRTETDIARLLGVNRLTVRRWLGK